MHSGQNRNRRTAVDRGNELRGKVQREVAISARNHLRGIGIRGGFQIVNISEAFGAQQLLGGVLRGKTNTRIARQPYRRRLRRPIRGARTWRPDEPRCAGRRQRRQKPPPGLSDSHWNPPSRETVIAGQCAASTRTSLRGAKRRSNLDRAKCERHEIASLRSQ
jgi:hypothetical protein